MARIEVPFIAPAAISRGWLSDVIEQAKRFTENLPDSPPEPEVQTVHLDEIPAPKTRTTLANE